MYTWFYDVDTKWSWIVYVLLLVGIWVVCKYCFLCAWRIYFSNNLLVTVIPALVVWNVLILLHSWRRFSLSKSSEFVFTFSTFCPVSLNVPDLSVLPVGSSSHHYSIFTAFSPQSFILSLSSFWQGWPQGTSCYWKAPSPGGLTCVKPCLLTKCPTACLRCQPRWCDWLFRFSRAP